MVQNDFLRLVIYQIYPRSFMDSDGDGIGDLGGIITKLDYLKELGINAIWLTPCFKSPNVDNGYDIADYRDIMDEFGTMEDMKRLIAEMHQRDMKVILDLVPNHTSTDHRWFQESRKSKDNPYSDYYYWFDTPPNNWESCWGGSAWQYDEQRGQYYLHSYAVEQADLNWNNPAVVKEMQDIVDFWVDMGVDGFRCDVIDQISKDFEKGENSFGPRLHEFIHALFGREKTSHLFTVGECWCDTIEEVSRHCHPTRGELTTLFQFDHIHYGREWNYTPGKPEFRGVRDILSKWQRLTNEHDLIYTLFTDNHDQPQFISRMSNYSPLRYEVATCVATMFYLLKGIPVIYQGQEFGTTASQHESIEEFNDIEARNFYKIFRETMSHEEAMAKINFGSRDNTRRPMCWDDSKYGGFSTADPWIALHSNQKQINLKNDQESTNSVFLFYQKLLRIRNDSNAILYGDFVELSRPEDPYFAFTRSNGEETILVICNFEREATIDLDGKKEELLLNNYWEAEGMYRPFEIRVFKKHNLN